MSPTPVQWERYGTTVELNNGHGIDLETGDNDTGIEDLRLVDGYLISQTGDLVHMRGGDLEMFTKRTTVPAVGYVDQAQAILWNTVILRLEDGRYAKIYVDNADTHRRNSMLPSPYDPNDVEKVRLTYYLSAPPGYRAVRCSVWCGNEVALEPRWAAANGGRQEAIPAALAGTWKLTVAASYAPTSSSTRWDGNERVRETTYGFNPGASLSTLSIRPDGSYTWSYGRPVTGRLHRIRPENPVPGQRYYLVTNGSETRVLRFDPSDGGVSVDFAGGKRVR